MKNKFLFSLAVIFLLTSCVSGKTVESKFKGPSDTPVSPEEVGLMPKGGDLHSHLSGAIPVDALLELAKNLSYNIVFIEDQTFVCGFEEQGIITTKWRLNKLCNDKNAVRKSVQEVLQNKELTAFVKRSLTVKHDDKDSEENYFNKFTNIFERLDLLTDRTNVIPILVQLAMEHAYENQVSYIELKINPIGREVSIKNLGVWSSKKVKIETLAESIRTAVRNKNEELKARWQMSPNLPPTDETKEWPEEWSAPVEVRLIVQGDRTNPLKEGGSTALKGIECSQLKNCPSRLEQGWFLVARSSYRDLFVALDLVRLPEINYGVSDSFVKIMAALRSKYGPINLTLHAGETKRKVWKNNIGKAISLGAKRIGHGFNLDDSPESTIEKICEKTIPLEISLSSNLALGFISDIKDHPFASYFRGEICSAGNGHLPMVLATDDAGIFETGLQKEFELAAATRYAYSKKSFLSKDELVLLARNSLVYSFVDAKTKEKLLRRFDDQLRVFKQQVGWTIQ